MNFFTKIIFCILIKSIIFFYSSCRPSNKYTLYEKQKLLMGTIFKITVFENKKHLPEDKFEKLAQMALNEVKNLEKQMSQYIPSSPISIAAKLSGYKPVQVCDDLIQVLEIANKISVETGGVFDISFGPLAQVWNIKNRKDPPPDIEIKKALKLVNHNNIILNKKNKTLFLKQKGMSVGLGGIAKGYAAKKASEVFVNAGYHNLIINAGGDLFVLGSKKDINGNNQHWVTGIKDPDDSDKVILRFKIKQNGAVVTSGDYERFFLYNGKKYHHIIDLKSGYPAWGNKSVTVFSTDPTYADAYATSFFILGFEKSINLVKNNPSVAFIMVNDKNEILKSPNVQEFVEFF